MHSLNWGLSGVISTMSVGAVKKLDSRWGDLEAFVAAAPAQRSGGRELDLG